MEEDRTREAAAAEENKAREATTSEEDRTRETTTAEEKKRTERRKSHAEGEEARRFRLTGCFAAKVTAYFLLLVSAALCAAGAVGCYIAAEEDMYVGSHATVLENALLGLTYRTSGEVCEFFDNGNEEAARIYLREINAEVAILRYEDRLVPDSSVFVWQSYDASEALKESGFYSDIYGDIRMSLYTTREGSEDYIVRVFYDPAFTHQDAIKETVRWIEALYQARYAVILLCAGSAILFVGCVIFLLCSAGHKNGREGIVPGPLTGIHLDVLICGVALAEIGMLRLMHELIWSGVSVDVCQIVACAVTLMLTMIFLYDFAIRLKLGKPWRHTLSFVMLRILRWGFCRLWRLLMGIPHVLTTVIVYLAACFLELLIIARFCRIYNEELFLFLWGLEKIVLFLVVLYIAQAFRRLLKASRELAEGHEDYRVDTKLMFWVFREQGENLNSLGQGVARAVSERMKSERLKTELITNVSHDLKTPLTSIINYAELINREAEENPAESQTIREYSEVLLRQSGRLKRLLENLVEASKAATGNLEVNLESCEAGVLLSQAVGEYQQRMEEKALELRVSQPEEPVRILADGRHLWRVFDNLLNNICKYAQENSRVYLTLEQKEKKAFIIFRNMSKYALDISPEELEERFVRGDKSRHMEGNGLGLSIAKSLTELQQGQMEIVVDGDLFKVILIFDTMD
ncbi:MAG: sensor histidine kinase [Acetatifactor sp.]|nr:sensor histidine kinase [Acetatifactor sp.]